MNGTNEKIPQNVLDAIAICQQFGYSGYFIGNEFNDEKVPLAYGARTKQPKLPKKNKNGEVLDESFRKGQEAKKFVKAFRNPIDVLTDMAIDPNNQDFSYKDFTWFMKLMKFADIESCVLYDYEKQKYMSIVDLSKAMGIDKDNLGTTMRKFEKLELVKKVKFQSMNDSYKSVNAYVINPNLFMNGDYPYKAISDEFANSKWAKL